MVGHCNPRITEADSGGTKVHLSCYFHFYWSSDKSTHQWPTSTPPFQLLYHIKMQNSRVLSHTRPSLCFNVTEGFSTPPPCWNTKQQDAKLHPPTSTPPLVLLWCGDFRHPPLLYYIETHPPPPLLSCRYDVGISNTHSSLSKCAHIHPSSHVNMTREPISLLLKTSDETQHPPLTSSTTTYLISPFMLWHAGLSTSDHHYHHLLHSYYVV